MITVPVTGISSIKNASGYYNYELSVAIAIDQEGNLYQAQVPKEPTEISFFSVSVIDHVTSITEYYESDEKNTIMLKTDGTLWGWGVNKNAQLGYGDYKFSYDMPVPVQQAISVELNGETLALSNGVVTRENQSYVPFRSIFEKLGAVVEWNNDTKIATITRKEGDQVAVQLKINTKNETIELNNKQVSNKPFSVNGTSYLPLRFISESLGAKVEWNQQAEINLDHDAIRHIEKGLLLLEQTLYHCIDESSDHPLLGLIQVGFD